MAASMWSALLLVAATASCSPVDIKLESPDLPKDIQHPEWIPWPPAHPDWIPLPPQHPEWIPWPPTHPDWIPLPPQHPEWIPWPPTHPDWIPLPPQHPEWIPWPPTHPDWIPLPPQHPEWIPWPPTKPDWWPEDGIDWDGITFPEEKPEWWPEFWESIKPDWFPDIDWENLERPQKNEGVPGTRASIEEYPSIVQIELGTGQYWAQGCVGSVLTSLHVLTSARCFFGRLYIARIHRVRAGSGIRSVGGTTIPVESILTHPSRGQSEENIFDSDITIARLSYFLTFSPSIAQAAIVSDGYQLPNDLPLTLASWGATAQGQRDTDDNLYTIGLVNLNSETCNNKWSELSFGLIKVTSNMICAARPETGGRNPDIRDIGAPIYYDNILVGLVSWGNSLGNQKFPVVATSISSYTNWIVQNAA